MRYMGVDYGDVRTGLAVSDASGFLATGIGYIKENGMKNTAKKVAELALAREVGTIVVGYPKNMNGTEGPRTEVVRAFVELLAAETTLPILLFDERLSTMEAHRFLSMTDVGGKKRKQVVDTLSAQIILQDFLDRQRATAK